LAEFSTIGLLGGEVCPDAVLPVKTCGKACLTGGVSFSMVSFGKKLQVYLKKYAVSEKFLERFEIKIPIDRWGRFR